METESINEIYKPKEKKIKIDSSNDFFLNIIKLDNSQSIIAIFVLLITLSTSFITETFNCQVRKLFRNNMFLKHLVIFMLIFVSSDVFSEEIISPLEQFVSSFKLWILFLLISKMNIYYTTIIFIIFIFIYILNQYNEYYKPINNNIEIIINQLVNIILILILIGFSSYFLKQKKFYKNKFKFYYFIFGKEKCKNLK